MVDGVSAAPSASFGGKWSAALHSVDDFADVRCRQHQEGQHLSHLSKSPLQQEVQRGRHTMSQHKSQTATTPAMQMPWMHAVQHTSAHESIARRDQLRTAVESRAKDPAPERSSCFPDTPPGNTFIYEKGVVDSAVDAFLEECGRLELSVCSTEKGKSNRFFVQKLFISTKRQSELLQGTVCNNRTIHLH